MMIASHLTLTRLWDLSDHHHHHHHGVKARRPLVGYGDASGHSQRLLQCNCIRALGLPTGLGWLRYCNDFLTTL